MKQFYFYVQTRYLFANLFINKLLLMRVDDETVNNWSTDSSTARTRTHKLSDREENMVVILLKYRFGAPNIVLMGYDIDLRDENGYFQGWRSNGSELMKYRNKPILPRPSILYHTTNMYILCTHNVIENGNHRSADFAGQSPQTKIGF
jgi:hypothetical protein